MSEEVAASELEKKHRNDRRVYAASELPEEWRRALLDAIGAPGTEHLDELDGTF